jgi:hypothetical protein
VVLENNTSHTIRAYTLRLTFVNSSGESGGRNRQFFNFEAKSNGMEIPVGSARLITALHSLATNMPVNKISSSLGGSSRASAELISVLRSQVAVVISIDLVVFDTGQVIGPNEGNTLSYLEGYLMGERETAAFVHAALLRGAALQEVSDQLNSLIARFDTGEAKEFDKLARASQARNLLRFASSQDALLSETMRILAKPQITLYR